MKIGLALGGGGARGIAHLGVWLRLRELGVPVHCVSGTSIGAIAGAVIAAGRVDAALKWCIEPDWKKLPKLVFRTKFSSKGLTSGTQVEKLLSELIGIRNFASLEMPFAAVATDLASGEAVVMRDGGLVSAVRASISIPGVFCPVERQGRILVDGQLVAPVPVAACRALGADKVIAVDINPPNSSSDIKPFARLNVIDVLTNTFTILNCELTRRTFMEEKPDLVIQPAVGKVQSLDFRHAERLVEIGRKAVAEDAIERLLAIAL